MTVTRRIAAIILYLCVLALLAGLPLALRADVNNGSQIYYLFTIEASKTIWDASWPEKHITSLILSDNDSQGWSLSNDCHPMARKQDGFANAIAVTRMKRREHTCERDLFLLADALNQKKSEKAERNTEDRSHPSFRCGLICIRDAVTLIAESIKITEQEELLYVTNGVTYTHSYATWNLGISQDWNLIESTMKKDIRRKIVDGQRIKRIATTEEQINSSNTTGSARQLCSGLNHAA